MSENIKQAAKDTKRSLPPGWRWVKLGEVCEVVNGFGFSEEYQGRNNLPYPFIKVSDMNTPGSEVIICGAANTVDMDILSQLRARFYPAGTIIKISVSFGDGGNPSPSGEASF
jgi:type I restriction enzyme S subunit